MDRFFLGVDLGGTFIKGGVVDEGGRVVARAAVATQAAEGQDVVIGRLHALLEDLARACPAGRKAVTAAGIGVAGAIDGTRGLLRFAPNLPGWSDVPLGRMLAERLGLPTALENDANAAAVGEHWVGAGRDCSTFVLYTLGTGVGGGLVLDGRLWRGRDGAAGELGHVVIHPGGDPCGCGRQGCLEAYASATAILRRLRAIPGAVAADSAPTVFRRAAAGDAACRRVLADAVEALGIAIAGMIHVLNPERILVGGGVAQAGEPLFGPLRDAVRRHALPVLAEGVTILPALLGEDAGLIGAAGCALKQFATSAS